MLFSSLYSRKEESWANWPIISAIPSAPPNEAELAYEWRRFRQRMIILGITLVICLIIACLYGMTLTTENHMMQGTWILQEDYEDGFHPKDRYLEYRNGTYYMSSSRFGKPTRRGWQADHSQAHPHGSAGSYP